MKHTFLYFVTADRKHTNVIHQNTTLLKNINIRIQSLFWHEVRSLTQSVNEHFLNYIIWSASEHLTCVTKLEKLWKVVKCTYDTATAAHHYCLTPTYILSSLSLTVNLKKNAPYHTFKYSTVAYFTGKLECDSKSCLTTLPKQSVLN
jgi:hypothetical protein